MKFYLYDPYDWELFPVIFEETDDNTVFAKQVNLLSNY